MVAGATGVTVWSDASPMHLDIEVTDGGGMVHHLQVSCRVASENLPGRAQDTIADAIAAFTAATDPVASRGQLRGAV